jgi:hypothetical protein
MLDSYEHLFAICVCMVLTSMNLKIVFLFGMVNPLHA